MLVLAVTIHSSFLMALVPLALGRGRQQHRVFSRTYMLIVMEPTITIVLFALLAFVAYFAANRVGPVSEGLGLVAGRVLLVLVNFGFWVGSFWGDRPGESWAGAEIDSGIACKAWEKAALHAPTGLSPPPGPFS